MKTILTLALLAAVLPGSLGAQNVAPISSSKNLPLGTEMSAETRAILQDRLQRDRASDIAAAMRIRSEAEAQLVVDSILDQANAAAIIAESNERARLRQRLAEANRTDAMRTESIDYLTRRLRGDVTATEVPESFRSRVVVEDPVSGVRVVRAGRPRFYDDNTRVVTYRNMEEIPPVLIASSRMNRVRMLPVAESPYAATLAEVARRPAEYVAPQAYAVSYTVDPNSEVTRDDILFVQGSTAFQDAYSYDLVQDLAMAISDPALADQSFVIEGHASAEGDYNENLSLSQARAERIAREIVQYGVSSSRLIPVGYGENEAVYPSDSADNLRSLDRRVAVFRLQPSVKVTTAP
jgi:outer membrane protein OmpA-like peptidoglycan-associated protein